MIKNIAYPNEEYVRSNEGVKLSNKLDLLFTYGVFQVWFAVIFWHIWSHQFRSNDNQINVSHMYIASTATF